MSYIRREETIEIMAARAICEGKAFADAYARCGPPLKAALRRSFSHTLTRLGSGEILDERDDDCISAMGEALVCAANDLCPGYGNRVLNVCTHEDFLISKELEDLRWFILKWESFNHVRGQVRCRVAARRLLNHE